MDQGKDGGGRPVERRARGRKVLARARGAGVPRSRSRGHVLRGPRDLAVPHPAARGAAEPAGDRARRRAERRLGGRSSLKRLELLAGSPTLPDDVEVFRRIARHAVDSRDDWRNIILVDGKGQQRLNFGAPPGAVLPSSRDRGWVASSLRDKGALRYGGHPGTGRARTHGPRRPPGAPRRRDGRRARRRARALHLRSPRVRPRGAARRHRLDPRRTAALHRPQPRLRRVPRQARHLRRPRGHPRLPGGLQALTRLRRARGLQRGRARPSRVGP